MALKSWSRWGASVVRRRSVGFRPTAAHQTAIAFADGIERTGVRLYAGCSIRPGAHVHGSIGSNGWAMLEQRINRQAPLNRSLWIQCIQTEKIAAVLALSNILRRNVNGAVGRQCRRSRDGDSGFPNFSAIGAEGSHAGEISDIDCSVGGNDGVGRPVARKFPLELPVEVVDVKLAIPPGHCNHSAFCNRSRAEGHGARAVGEPNGPGHAAARIEELEWSAAFDATARLRNFRTVRAAHLFELIC